MKLESERDTYMGALCLFGYIFAALLGMIGSALFCDMMFIKALTIIATFRYSIYCIKNETIPLIHHFNNKNNQGDILQGKVETIKFRGDHLTYAYEIEGYYLDYNDIKYRCGLKDLYRSGKIPQKIDIKVNIQKPSVYCVCGIEYLRKLKETFPEYFS